MGGDQIVDAKSETEGAESGSTPKGFFPGEDGQQKDGGELEEVGEAGEVAREGFAKSEEKENADGNHEDGQGDALHKCGFHG